MNRKSKKSFGPRKKPLVRNTQKKSEFTLAESRIMSVLRKDSLKSYQSRELLRLSGVTEKEKFYEAVKNLAAKGFIKVDKSHVVTLNSGEKSASLVSISKGFGFARPEEGGGDIFIHGSALNGAMIGDKILVGDIRDDIKGTSGSVHRILEHGKETTTGTIVTTDFGAELHADIAIRYNPTIAAGDLMGAKEGDKVLVKLMQDFRGDWSRAKVIKIFGSGDSARVCSDAIIEQYGIPMEFPEEVMAEANEVGNSTITEEELRKRLDLRNEPIFTIDGADAKDLDDAICVKKTDSGYSLDVHIADVSHYVKGRSKLDEEAMTRGTSVYFADRVIPMLPEVISNGVCSLNAGTDKLTFSALMELDKEGQLVSYKFRKSIINSKVRGVYSEVNEIFAGTAGEELMNKYAPVMDGLMAARELAKILESNAKARGTMEIESGESQFVLDENGVCVDVVPRSQGEAEGMIEQMMVSANTAAAKISVDAGIPFLYRIHESPDPERVSELCELLRAVGLPCKEIMKDKPVTGDFAAIMKRAKGTAFEVLVSQRVLRTMEKAKYSTEPKGHFGLALQDYSHFTSPIRRYPDTSIHRILTALCEGDDPAQIAKRYSTFAKNSAAESSKNEVRAVNAERDAEDCYMAEYMRGHLGEKYHGVVSGATKNGVFVRLANNVEGFIPNTSWKENDFLFDGIVTQKCRKTGRVLTIGTEVDIIVASANVAMGMVDFAPDE